MQKNVQILTDNNNIDIDQVSFSICCLFDSAGKTTFRSRCTECIYGSKDVDNPWFNKECRNKRTNYRRARGKYRRSKSDIDKNLVDQACKKYKNTMILARKEYTKKKQKLPED